MQNNNRPGFIHFIGDINERTMERLIQHAYNCKARGHHELQIHISSTGGELSAAFAAYAALRSTGLNITTHNIGSIESSAITLYLAGDIRLSIPGGLFRIHGFCWDFGSRGHTGYNEIREAVDTLDQEIKRHADVFNERAKIAKRPIEIVKCLQGKAVVISAGGPAYEAGLITTPTCSDPLPFDGASEIVLHLS